MRERIFYFNRLPQAMISITADFFSTIKISQMKILVNFSVITYLCKS